MLGKLKHSMRERCPYCNKPLQVRAIQISTLQKGVEILIDEEYICCSNKNCDYEQSMEQKRVRRSYSEE